MSRRRLLFRSVLAWLAATLSLVVTLGSAVPTAIAIAPNRASTYVYDTTSNISESTLVPGHTGTAALAHTNTPFASSVGDLSARSAAFVAADTGAPLIKAGSAGGESAGKVFPQGVKDAARAENPSTCVYCRMETDSPQIDHAIPRARGGNATLDNAQTTCSWCNASKGARDFPVNPPSGYRGAWPPEWWGLP